MRLSRRADRWALAGLAALVLLVRRDLILAPPTHFIDTVDYTRYFAWLHEYVGDRLRAGHLPLWNPYNYAGLPLAANPQVAVFYPPTWLHAVLPVALAHRLSVVLHTLAAGAFAYLYFRRVKLSASAAVVGALPWMLGSYLTANAAIGHLSMMSTAVWIPLILYFYEGAAETGRGTDYVLAGAALGAQLLAGEPQNTYYTLVIVAVYGAVRFEARWRAIVAWLASLAIVGGVALLVAAAQVLPTAEMVRHSDRSTTTYAFATGGSFAPSSLAGLIAPWSLSTQFLAAGHPAHNVATVTWEYALYPGVLTLVLALAALGRVRPPPLRAAHVLLAVGLVIMLGSHTPLYRLLFEILPGLRLFRIPARAIVIVIWSLCVLAAHGLQRVIGERPLPWRGWWRFAALVMIAALGAAWIAVALGGVYRRTPASVLIPITLTDRYGLQPLLWLGLAGAFVVALPTMRPRTASASAIALLAADLVFAQPAFPLSGDDTHRQATVRALAALREAAPGELFRVDFGPWQVEPLASIGARVENANGYWPFSLGRFFRYAHAVRGRDHRDVARYELGEPLYERPYPFERSLLNVLYSTQPVGPGKVGTVRGSRILPRAWMVGEVEVAPDGEAALARVLAAGFDARSVVVLEEPPPVDLRGGRPPGTAVARRVDDAELAIDTDTAAPGYLVLSEMHYPGWHASVDGESVRLQRADYVLTALPVPAGRHRVRYWYDPLSARLGLLVSGLSLVGIAGMVARRRRAPGPAVQTAGRK